MSAIIEVDTPDGVAEFPAGTSPETIKAALQAKYGAPKPQRSFGEQAARVAGNFGGGFNRSAVETVGALPEMVNSAVQRMNINMADLPGFPGRPPRDRRPVGVEPGTYTRAIQNALDSVIGTAPTPENTVERFAHGAGRGAADALAVSSGAAGVANLATGPVTRGVASTMASTPVAQTVYGAAGGGVGEATGSPALGVATSIAGPLAAGLARNAVAPGGIRLNAEQRRLAALLAREGVNLTPAQATGSTPLKIIDAVSENLPLTAGRMRDINQGQREAFTAAAMRAAGENSTSASPDAIQAARQRLGSEFNRLSQGRTVPLGQRVTQALTDIDAAQSELRGVVPTESIDRMVQGATAMVANGSIKGETAQRLRSELTKAAKDAANSQNTRLADALRTFRDAIDDSIRDALTPAEAGAWDTARRQYANLKVIERGMSGSGAEAASGTLPPNALRSAVGQANRNNYAAGAGDLNDLARAGQAFLRPVPSSGTAERTAWQSILSGGPAAYLVGAGEPGSAVAAALATLLGPKLAQTAIHSQAGTRALTSPTANQDTAALIAALLAAKEKQSLLAPPR